MACLTPRAMVLLRSMEALRPSRFRPLLHQARRVAGAGGGAGPDAGPQGGAEGGAAPGGEAPRQDDVVEADYEIVDDKK